MNIEQPGEPWAPSHRDVCPNCGAGRYRLGEECYRLLTCWGCGGQACERPGCWAENHLCATCDERQNTERDRQSMCAVCRRLYGLDDEPPSFAQQQTTCKVCMGPIERRGP